MRISSCSALVATALLAAASGAARAEPDNGPGPTAPQHGPHLQAAIRLYQKLDLDAAQAELRLAEEEASRNEDETVTVLIYEGLIFAENGRNSEMVDHFKRALAMRPWAEVPEGTAPRLARQFTDARKDLWGSGGIKPPPKKRRSAAAAPTPAPAAAPATAPAAAPSPAATPAPAESAPALTPPPEQQPAAPAGGGLEPPK